MRRGIKIQPIDTMNIEENIYASMINVNGATIKKDGTGYIRFEAQIDDELLSLINSNISNVIEIGFLMLPKAYLDNGDLTYADKYASIKYGEKSISKGCYPIEDLPDNFNGIFYCYLNDSNKNFLATTLAARAYVKLNDGTYVYSDNSN